MNFKWSCGHSFEWDDTEAKEWFKEFYLAGGKDVGPCLDCLYPEHEPQLVECERCGALFTLTIGQETVCDDCLVPAAVESLGHISQMMVEHDSRN